MLRFLILLGVFAAIIVLIFSTIRRLKNLFDKPDYDNLRKTLQNKNPNHIVLANAAGNDHKKAKIIIYISFFLAVFSMFTGWIFASVLGIFSITKTGFSLGIFPLIIFSWCCPLIFSVKNITSFKLLLTTSRFANAIGTISLVYGLSTSDVTFLGYTIVKTSVSFGAILYILSSILLDKGIKNYIRANFTSGWSVT